MKSKQGFFFFFFCTKYIKWMTFTVAMLHYTLSAAPPSSAEAVRGCGALAQIAPRQKAP